MLKAFDLRPESELLRLSPCEVPPNADRGHLCQMLPWHIQELL